VESSKLEDRVLSIDRYTLVRTTYTRCVCTRDVQQWLIISIFSTCDRVGAGMLARLGTSVQILLLIDDGGTKKWYCTTIGERARTRARALSEKIGLKKPAGWLVLPRREHDVRTRVDYADRFVDRARMSVVGAAR
jgi:hypothetical protein